jgi:hypothetical protein
MRTTAWLGLAAITVAGCYGTGAGPASSVENPAVPMTQLAPMKPAAVAIALDTFGIAVLTPAECPAVAVLHTRLTLTNPGGGGPWRFDPQATRVELAGVEVFARFANADVATLPIVIVEPDARVVVDLYFAVPDGVTDVTELEVRTEIATVDRRLDWHGRVDAVPPALARTGGPVAGWGRHWWSDPAFAWTTYHRRPGIATQRPPADVTVDRQPPRFRLR